jgi:hypothetical protein
MTKKYYIAPEAELEKFTILDTITTSVHGGIGDGGNDGGDIDLDSIETDAQESFFQNFDFDGSKKF